MIIFQDISEWHCFACFQEQIAKRFVYAWEYFEKVPIFFSFVCFCNICFLQKGWFKNFPKYLTTRSVALLKAAQILNASLKCVSSPCQVGRDRKRNFNELSLKGNFCNRSQFAASVLEVTFQHHDNSSLQHLILPNLNTNIHFTVKFHWVIFTYILLQYFCIDKVSQVPNW